MSSVETEFFSKSQVNEKLLRWKRAFCSWASKMKMHFKSSPTTKWLTHLPSFISSITIRWGAHSGVSDPPCKKKFLLENTYIPHLVLLNDSHGACGSFSKFPLHYNIWRLKPKEQFYKIPCGLRSSWLCWLGSQTAHPPGLTSPSLMPHLHLLIFLV